MRLFLCLFLLFSPFPLWAGAAGQSEGISLDFLYVNANAGEAAGGHTALRLSDSIFHYQFFPDSSFLLVREPWDHFRFLYNDLHNRSISLASLPLKPEMYTRIRNHFTEVLVEQQQFFDAFHDVLAEEMFVRKMLAGRYELAVPGLGFFAEEATATLPTSTLAGRIEGALGRDFLQQAVTEAEAAVQRTIAGIAAGDRAGRNLQEQVEWQEALRVLAEGRTLEERELIAPLAVEGDLSGLEREFLQKFSEQLVHSILELLQSRRPDKGESLLLQTARYLVVQRSLAAGRLYTLDPFPDDVRRVELTERELGEERLLFLQEDLLGQAKMRRRLFFQEELHPEIAYSFLEASRGRAWELEQLAKGEKEVRILARMRLPSRSRMLSLGKVQLKEEVLSAVRQVLAEEMKGLRAKSAERYGYSLFQRNCATELIRSLNTSFPDAETGRAALGGWLEPDSGLLFVPFLFFEESLAAYSLQEKSVLPARRLRNLEDLYHQESDLLVWLRESNTLTSTLYEPRVKDTPFLFFTDDTLLLRPLQGILNVGYAALHGVAGMATFPLDGGERFHQAARGIFYSLPELGFGNIRKGSYSTGENRRAQ